MTDIELLINLFITNPRQGPGSDTETEKALECIGFDREKPLNILDIGCGTGSQTLAIAKWVKGRITAMDLFPEFLEILKLNAEACNLNQTITTLAGNMNDLPFSENEFDLIWSEGAIYNIGFEKGIREWRPFLKSGGFIAVSEISWITDSRPIELEDYWLNVYPEIDTISNKNNILERNGYSPVASFVLPADCWIDNYYSPLKQGFANFLSKYGNDPRAIELVENERKEIALYEKFSKYYSYAFYVAKKT